MSGKLYIVSTPIGNLDDVSIRMKKTIEESDFVIAEDTRRTGNLLSHLGIKKPMVSFFAGNENQKAELIVKRLVDGETASLVSDAGTPLLSDPGFPLVRFAIENNIDIVPIPGPSAMLSLLVASGLPCDRFTFAGYPPDKKGKREKWLTELSLLNHTVIMYLSPWKVDFMLEDVLAVFGDRKACLAREITKLHEEFIRGSVSEIIQKVKDKKPKGEYCFVIE